MLRMEAISKSFGPTQALKNVSFSAEKGTVHAICGENGAGKSTLMKILAGVHRPDSGQIFIDDSERDFRNPGEAIEAGISMLFQELDLAEHLKVYENLFLAKEIMSAIPFVMNRKAMIEKTRKLCASYGFVIDPSADIGSLTTGQCQIVELLKAVMRETKIIVMDEPTSSLSEGEAQKLFQVVAILKAKGFTILYISHRLEEVLALADHITILRDGEAVASGPVSAWDIPSIVNKMVGRELKDFYPARTSAAGAVCFEVEGLSSVQGIQDISFSVRAGEIVGMAGLIGAGRTEVANAIFGVSKRTAGRLFLKGQAISVKRPIDAVRQGIAFLTEDRKRTGLCTGLPSSWNITLPNFKKIGMRSRIDRGREQELCLGLSSQVSLKWSHPDAPIDSLSGGNQQKVLISRWILSDAEFFIFDEPTRGIDVGARKEVYGLIDKLAASGKGILMISSDLPEIFGVCDRILVMREGRLVGDFPRNQTTPERVMHLAAVES